MNIDKISWFEMFMFENCIVHCAIL